jgi:hypothetical protein
MKKMNVPIQSSSILSDTLKERKAHLVGLLNVIKARSDKTTKVQTLTINAIKAEMGLIEYKLRKRS